MPATSRALVQLGPHRLEERELPIPPIGSSDGLLRVERCGICGSDLEQLNGDLRWVPYPVIPGHEPVGIIEEIGPDAVRRWGVKPGDRVVVEAPVPCRHCEYCAQGLFTSCPDRIRMGFTSIEEAPGLYGAYSEFLYLHPRATLHPVSADLDPDLAVLYNTLAGGIAWVCDAAGTKLGDTVVILGGGQRGIACGIAAKASGAETVILTGLSRDAHKLRVAQRLGVDATIDVEREDLVPRVAELTGGRMADIVIDVVPNAAETVTHAVDLVRTGGTVVIAGIKGEVPVPGLMTDKIAIKALTVRGVHGKRSDSYRRAISILESGRFGLEELAARAYPLAEAERALEDLARASGAPGSICVSIAPHA